jgi:hypothetical protein
MSEHGDHEDEFAIADWISLTRISEEGARKLDKFQISDLATLMLIREQDVDTLKFSFADSLRFRDGIAKLHEVGDVKPPLIDDKGNIVPKPVAVKSTPEADPDAKTYLLRDVEHLLAGKEAIAAGAGVVQKPESSGLTGVNALVSLLGGASGAGGATGGSTNLLALLAALLSPSAGSPSSDVRELMRDLLNIDTTATNSRGEKALLPVNFLSCVRGSQDSDEVIHSGKGLNLVLHASNKRVSAEKLSVGQWVGANARILEKLISSGKLTPAQITDHLVYNRKIGDLLQIYTSGSVFLLDHNHRLEVNENDDIRWCEVDATLQNAHLSRKNVQSSDVVSGKTNAPTNRRNSRKGVCWAYNTAEGCPNAHDRCKYEHSDSGERTPRSSGAYERAPRFQKGGTQA